MKIEANDFLHPRIIETCLPLFKDGHYQHVALESMKQVEMALRDKAIAPKELFGVHLVKWVMGNGEHITLAVSLGDDYQEKAQLLFKGAFGYYRNYAAHDGVKIDKVMSFRVMILASELLTLVAASNKSIEGIGGIDGLIKSGIFKSFQEFKDFLDFLDGQQIIESDVSDYDIELEGRGFTKIQEQAMYEFGFVSYDEWESAIDYKSGIFDSIKVGDIKLTDEGLRVYRELEKKLSGNHKGG